MRTSWATTARPRQFFRLIRFSSERALLSVVVVGNSHFNHRNFPALCYSFKKRAPLALFRTKTPQARVVVREKGVCCGGAVVAVWWRRRRGRLECIWHARACVLSFSGRLVTSRRLGRLPGRFSSKWPTETGNANGKQKRVCVLCFYALDCPTQKKSSLGRGTPKNGRPIHSVLAGPS